MPSLMVSLGGKPHTSYSIVKQRTRIGRWAENDIVLKSWSVSGSHAVLIMEGSKLSIEDLGSRNGTFVADARIARMDLADGAVVRIGDYTLTLVADRAAMAYEPTMMVRSTPGAQHAYLLRISGSPLGETIELNKVVMTLGKPGVCVVTCIRRLDAFAVRFTDGAVPARLNGIMLTDAPVRLNPGDVLEMDSDRLRFLIREPGSD
jgi:hypothetical protein